MPPLLPGFNFSRSSSNKRVNSGKPTPNLETKLRERNSALGNFLSLERDSRSSRNNFDSVNQDL